MILMYKCIPPLFIDSCPYLKGFIFIPSQDNHVFYFSEFEKIFSTESDQCHKFDLLLKTIFNLESEKLEAQREIFS